MKIIVPAVQTEVVGTRVIYADDLVFNAANRVNVYGEATELPIKEAKLVGKVIFDRDLRASERLTAIGHLAAYVAFIAVLFPLALVSVVGEQIGNLIERFGDYLGDLLDRAGVPTRWGIRDTFRAIFTEIVR